MTKPVRIVAALAMAFGAATAAQQPARDNAPPTPRMASISGTVLVDGAARQPARRVRVTLTDLANISPGQTTTTDDKGAFVFPGLPSGRFELRAFKPGYLRGSYGATRPNRAGTPVVVKDGEAIANLTMAIARGGVITGVVRDMRGRPVPGMNVRVLKLSYNAVTGELTLGAPSSGSAAVTDDRGEYRAYGLPPGGYLVLVPAPPQNGPGLTDIRQLTTSDVQQALQAARAGGANVGAAIRSSAGPSPPPPARVNYAPIFHPGVTDITAAATIALGLGEERGGVDITTQLVPSATVSGTISVTPGGTVPNPLVIQLVPAGAQTEMLAGAGLRGASMGLRPDGTYLFTGVAPGTYTIKAGIGRGRGAAAPSGPELWASADVTVNGRDVEVPLTLQPGVTLNGRVIVEGAQPTPAELQTLAFMLVPPGSGGALQTFGGGGRVDAEGRFTFPNVVPDTYQFVTTWTAPGASEKWTMRASTANGRDAFEAPLRVSPNERLDWTVTFTDKPTTLRGILQDRSGRAATDYYVLVYPADRKYWMPGSRRIRMTRPATDGGFSIKGLPADEYLVAALTDLEAGEWNDPTLLDQIVRSSVKVTLRDGETTTQDFRIGGS